MWKIDYVNPTNIFQNAIKYVPERILSNGKTVAEFEERAAEYLGSKFAVATSSCTIALFCIWEALKIVGKKVLLPSYTWRSTADAVRMAGGIPIFGDIDRSLCLDIDSSDNIDFICPVDTFGNPANYDACINSGKTYVIDSAHSFGSKYQGEKIGKYGIHAFSFSPTKVLVANEGGLISCNDENLAKELKEVHRRWAGRMTEYNAACALEGLKNLPRVLEKKNEIASKYRNYALRRGWEVQRIHEKDYSTFKDVIIILDSESKRDALNKHLNDAGIETKIYFVPAHTIEKYGKAERRDLGYTEKIYRTSLCVPSWVGIDQNYVLQAMDSFKGD